jgi:hypothetical protein
MPRTFSQHFRKFIARFHATFTGIFNPYRPELYYMRGPGPKWHAARARQHRR